MDFYFVRKRVRNTYIAFAKRKGVHAMAQANRQTRTQANSKRNSWLPWLLLFIAFGLFVAGFFFTRNTDTALPEQTDFTQEMKNYFKQDGTVATFNREGNTLIETTTWLNEQYVQLLIEHNASKKQEIYRIDEQTIDLVYSATIHIEQLKTFTEAELNDLQVIDTILQWPLDSKRFGSKNMLYPVQFETSLLIFANAVGVERTDDAEKTIDYYAEGYGFIGREYIFNDTLFNKIQLNELAD